jgi:hypothetical protein
MKNCILLFFLVICIFKVFYTLTDAQENANVFLFSRDLETKKLRYTDAQRVEFGEFDVENTICAQKKSFLTYRSYLNDYKVIELDDFNAHSDIILSHVPSNNQVIVINSTDKKWYTISKDLKSSSLDALSYEILKPQLSGICFNDESITLPDDPNRWRIIFMFSAGFPMACSFMALYLGCFTLIKEFSKPEKKRMILYWTGLMSLLFSSCILIYTGLVIPNAILPFLSVIINLETLIMIILFLCNGMSMFQRYLDSKSASSHLKIELPGALAVLVLILVLFLGLVDYIGPDNASPYTGHYYANAMVEDLDDIKSHIRVM